MAKRKVSGVEIEADRIVAALVDRLIATERRYEEVQKQLKEQFEMIAELQPKMSQDGGAVSMRAMKLTDDSAEEYEVTFAPFTTRKI